MVQQIVNEIVPVVVAAAVAVLVAIIKAVGDAAVSFIEKKKEALEAQIGSSTYAQRLDFARQAWGIVDEYFRITPDAAKTIDAAQAKFAEVIKKMVPSLTDEEIAQLRQAVAGEVNKGKAAIASASVTETTPESVR